jgi:hypothetical protein
MGGEWAFLYGREPEQPDPFVDQPSNHEIDGRALPIDVAWRQLKFARMKCFIGE